MISNWLAARTFPERKRRQQASHLDSYLPLIREQWAQGCHNMTRIYRELTKKGFKRSYESVRNLVISLQQDDHRSPLKSGTPISSRQTVWLFLRRPEGLTTEEQETIALLCTLDAEVDSAYDFVQQLARMMRDRTGEENFDSWLEDVAGSLSQLCIPLLQGSIKIRQRSKRGWPCLGARVRRKAGLLAPSSSK